MMHDDIKEIFISEEELKAKITELAAQITKDYEDKNPIVICVLKGAAIFMTDLIKELNFPLAIDFMCTSSYGSGMKTSGTVKIIKDLDCNIEGRNLLIVEDIFDSGLTLDYLIRLLNERKPASLKVCSLLIKDTLNRSKDLCFDIDYEGYHIKDEFVVGYGLDYAEKYRNLPYIGVLKEEIYTEK